jgi:hypothetical protein
MRMLIAIAFACTLMLGVNHAANSGTTEHGAQPTELSTPAADWTDDTGSENATQYECKFSPYCQRASQCAAYCAGGIPVCFQGCCTCAS